MKLHLKVDKMAYPDVYKEILHKIRSDLSALKNTNII